MAPFPDGGLIFALPQLGQPLFVQGHDSGVLNRGEVVNCGEVVSCELCQVSLVEIHIIRVRTTTHQDQFGVFLAPGIPWPNIPYLCI